MFSNLRSWKRFMTLATVVGVIGWSVFSAIHVFSSSIPLLEQTGDTATTSETILKPGEAPDFVPTPVPDVPLPPNVKPETPGQPAGVKSRPSPEDLAKLIPPPLPPDAPYQMAAVYDIMPRPSKSIAYSSEAIVLAKVHQIHPAHWNTANGKRPPNPHDRNNPGYILTRISVKIEQTLAGDVKPGQILTLMENGGKVGEDELRIESPYPAFVEGQVVLLYLVFLDSSKFPDHVLGRPDKLPVVLGRYTVDPSTNLATDPFEQRPLADLIAEINEAQQLKAQHLLPKP